MERIPLMVGRAPNPDEPRAVDMSLKIYHVVGIRHFAVIFASSPEEAAARAVERGLVGSWEAPDAVEVPLPAGYYLAYDPPLAAKQPELPLSLTLPEPDKPHTITRSGVKVYDDWHDNIVVDAGALPLVWKASRDIFGINTSVPGQPYLASENSEDALSWNLFRTLERTGHLDMVARALGLEDEFQVLYWYRPWDSAEPLPEIKAALDRMEPWGKVGGRYQTETDIILKGQRTLVMVECKLGRPGAHVRAWERGSKGHIPLSYEEPLRDLLADTSKWEATMRRFYQLMRHLLLANELCRTGGWLLEPHLLAVVNALNVSWDGKPHAVEFEAFRSALRLSPEQMHLLTWQELLTRAEATFDPSVQPLLIHARRLRYLQPPENQAG
jgi:hypothetical protein